MAVFEYNCFVWSVIMLLAIATSDTVAQNMKCEMSCALNYSHVSFLIARPSLFIVSTVLLDIVDALQSRGRSI